MDIYAKKISLIHWLTELNDISLINKIEEIKDRFSNSFVQSTLSVEDLIQRHSQSENEIIDNLLINQDILSAYFENK